MLSGRVVRTVQEINPHTGLCFLVLVVDTGKVTVDAVAPPDLLPGIRDGMFLQGGGWVLAKFPTLE
ncbi:MAG: hypothetical protein N0A24_00835 [Armatimonadetes bacterium]|nr:hypothetical protein [Armatimonadota bacterium]MDW8152765.1 hypothetical protein [Armatimonadota bacterium]